MTRPAKALVFLLAGILAAGLPAMSRVWAAAVPLALNEFMAANGGALLDPQGDSEDWVEIYNAGNQTIDMAGMYLTDDPEVARKWRVPMNAPQLTKVPARGYILVWLDGHTADAGLHASFSLDAEGEQIRLFDADGVTLIDSVSFKKQRGNVSYGRFPDGTGAWAFLTAPTPRAANASAYQGVVADTKFNYGAGSTRRRST